MKTAFSEPLNVFLWCPDDNLIMIFACGSYMRKNSALAESLVDVPGHHICPEEHSKTEIFLLEHL